ncbi:MAG: hypothetical protein KF864_13460 [Phycisphaeraceae bacterium]|nr:hypothetical protein [Phycisphaeraceae bacterium]
MKEQLATELLVTVMGWDDAEVAQERPYLQALAEYKYDEYQQFSPGMRFIESLAIWLRQFQSPEEQKIAYRFVKERLVFFSAAEIAHLVAISYPDLIRPTLIRRAAQQLNVDQTRVTAVARSQAFEVLERQCLFLGLSDGARLDIFRRSNPHLSHDQIYRTHEISDGRAEGLHGDLKKELAKILGCAPTEDQARFTTIVLIDDFTASGKSFLRDEGGKKKGKISKWLEAVGENGELRGVVDATKLHVCTLFYVAADAAVDRLREELGAELRSVLPNATYEVLVGQRLDKAVPLSQATDAEFVRLVDSNQYYNDRVYDEHMKKGRGDGRRGFDEGLLPIVLTHNTPNNSVLLLWANPDEIGDKVRGLFPRVSRHRSNR